MTALEGCHCVVVNVRPTKPGQVGRYSGPVKYTRPIFVGSRENWDQNRHGPCPGVAYRIIVTPKAGAA